MKVSTKDALRASRPRASVVAALCAVTASLLFAAAAPSAITTGPVDAASGFPFS